MADWKLPPEKKAGLLDAQRTLHDLLPKLDNAEECGIECREYRRLVDEAHQRINKILQHYG